MKFNCAKWLPNVRYFFVLAVEKFYNVPPGHFYLVKAVEKILNHDPLGPPSAKIITQYVSTHSGWAPFVQKTRSAK